PVIGAFPSTSLRKRSGRALQFTRNGQTLRPTRNFFFSSVCFFIYEIAPEEFIYPVDRRVLLGAGLFALIVGSQIADSFPASGPVIRSKKAHISSASQAAAPKKAP